jgi:RHS repeat-associated protein
LDSYGADPRRIDYAGANVDGASVKYAEKYLSLQQTIKDRYAMFEVPYLGKDNDDYVNGQGFCCDNMPANAPAHAPSTNDNPELFQYYYHSDHLGSTSLITNLDGEVVQHIEYVPFSEVFIEERNNKWNTPYLFNAKELDEETGLYYYGARYYEPRVSLWLSADPMQEKYPGVSSYAYALQNPVRFIDPDGRCPDCENDNYLIQKGDNFWNLEKKWGLQHGLLSEWNPGVNPNNLQIGQTIKAFGLGDTGQAVYVDNQFQFSTNAVNTGKNPDITIHSFTTSEWQSRPDADGKLSLSEANEWYRGNSGNPLFADASKINLSPISVNDFKGGVGSSMYNNFASLRGNTETGLVYGTIKLTLNNSNGQVTLGSGGLLDKYDFDYQKGRTLRNIATWIGEKNAGKGTSFLIYTYGTGQVKK